MNAKQIPRYSTEVPSAGVSSADPALAGPAVGKQKKKATAKVRAVALCTHAQLVVASTIAGSVHAVGTESRPIAIAGGGGD